MIDPADRTHILKGYLAWELPFGQGRRFMISASGLVDALVGGWMASAIFRYESGQPLRILSRNSYTGWSTFGYPIYANADPTDIGSALFGQVISRTGQPRQGQLGGRFEW